MPTPGPFEAVLAALTAQLTTPVLVGGWALGYYGVARQTLDADLMIAETDFDLASGILSGHGYRLVYRSPLFARFQGEAGMMDVDLLFLGAEVLKPIAREGKTVALGGVAIRVPSLRHLLAMKLHALKHNGAERAGKDLPDILNLLTCNDLTLDGPEFAALCASYGTPEILGQLKVLAGGPTA